MGSDSERVEQLAAAARAGLAHEITVVAGRDALRIRSAEGTTTSFLSAAEVIALRAALDEGPPTLSHPGLPACEWKAARACFAGRDARGLDVVIYDVELDPSGETLERLARLYARAIDALPEILADVAARLEPKVNGAWRADREALSVEDIQARLAADAIILSGEGAPVLMLPDGDLFAGHSIEVSLDEHARVRDATIAG